MSTSFWSTCWSELAPPLLSWLTVGASVVVGAGRASTDLGLARAVVLRVGLVVRCAAGVAGLRIVGVFGRDVAVGRRRVGVLVGLVLAPDARERQVVTGVRLSVLVGVTLAHWST